MSPSSARVLPFALVLLVGTLLGCAQAQIPINPNTSSVLAFSLQSSASFAYVSQVGVARDAAGQSVDADAIFQLQVKDLSSDPDPSDSTPVSHSVELSASYVATANPNPETAGWGTPAVSPASGITQTGDTFSAILQVSHSPTLSIPEVEVILNVKMRYADTNFQKSVEHRNETISQNFSFIVRVIATPGIQLQILYDPPISAPLIAAPNSWVTVPVRIENTDFYPAQVEIQFRVAESAGVEPSNIPVTGTGLYLLEPRGSAGSSKIVNLSFRTPKEQIYYGSASLQYTVLAKSIGQTDFSVQTDGVMAVQGFYFSRQLLIGVPLVLLAALVGFLVLFFGRRYYNEHVLGQPIPPWRLAPETKELNRLKTSDPRSFYVLRYFVMEQEYQSALNWFEAYRKRARREIRNRAIATSYMERAHALEQPDLTPFDRRAERIRRRIHRRQERQKLKGEAKIEKLQAKLDQHYEEDFEKLHSKWEEKVEKIKKAANKPWYKAHKKWEVEVEKITEEWEKPFRKEKARHEKEVAKARSKYEAHVKKEDKQAWRDWQEAVENAERENKVRAKEGRDPLPLPELLSQAVGPPELPAPFKEPPRPKLPAEPKPPKELDLPPEPQHSQPILAESRYARKERRIKRKTERKVRRLEKKLNRMLARNERDRVKALAKADRKKRGYLRKSEKVLEPSLAARLFHLTPEDRERRNAKRLQKALARERIKSVEEQESTRLEVMSVEAKREEAELLARLIRDRAEVRKGGASAGMNASRVTEEELRLETLREKNAARLEKERLAAEARIAKARAKIEEELAASTERPETRPEAAKPAADSPRKARPGGKSKG